MNLTTLSACITTVHVTESRDFYVKYFDAVITFDCGWYVNLAFGHRASLQFMAPQPDQPTSTPVGLTYNFCVSDVDAEHQRLMSAGLSAIMPLEDHPWGDRGFAVQDPNGVVLYIYSDREPSAEFKPFFKS
ncbi:MAG: VOC family protein [Rhodoferax sp.]|uniref:VOC family protein n=1 Tax=Rhodoferax sp. TaxID=50421 RepID=UPI001B4EDC79|nr:VOC family protein [Rhodoferax sp.]MBP9150250.1 VOC family protein [Rhodoferax sp.]MBP9737931.1 VOC family protein [Rhodoferax sp.]